MQQLIDLHDNSCITITILRVYKKRYNSKHIIRDDYNILLLLTKFLKLKIHIGLIRVVFLIRKLIRLSEKMKDLMIFEWTPNSPKNNFYLIINSWRHIDFFFFTIITAFCFDKGKMKYAQNGNVNCLIFGPQQIGGDICSRPK